MTVPTLAISALSSLLCTETNYDLMQLSGLVVPDGALPEELRGTPGPGGGLNPYLPELYR
ncbi:MAG: hypothetical protein ABR609_13730 [Acidimicrobiia bacterium]